MPLAPFTTTVVGAYSLPRWYEALEKQVEAGLLTMYEMADAQWRASQAALLDQEVAGIDVPNGGEMHRRTNNRHAPPNAMLNHFWEKMEGYSGTRSRNITVKDPNVFHPAAVFTGPVGHNDLGLVDEFRFVAANARNPDNVKVTMTGPHMLAKVAWDEYYGDITRFMRAFSENINAELRKLDEAGCKHVQLDEPLYTVSDRSEVQDAVDCMNQCFEGVKAFKWVHICQGNYAMGAHYDGQIGHRYFDTGEFPTDLTCAIECDAFMNEGDMTPTYEGLLANQQLAIGAADVQDMNVETPEQLVERMTTWGLGSWLAKDQTLITSSCGMNHLPRHIALGKLKAMTGARDLLRGH